MADFADMADEINEAHLEDSLRKHREFAAKQNALLGAFTGKCLNCGEEVSHGRFCETTPEDEKKYGSCRKDWELTNRHIVQVYTATHAIVDDYFDDPDLTMLGEQL